MARKYGSTDKYGRKERSDKGKKRKLYRGKPVVGRKNKPFKSSKPSTKSTLKIWIWIERPMSPDGRLNWHRRVRRFAPEVVYVPLKGSVHEVHVSEINNQKKLEQWVADRYYPSTFIIKGFSRGSNKFGCKSVRLARIVVKENQGGYYGVMTDNYRLKRYRWFFKNE